MSLQYCFSWQITVVKGKACTCTWKRLIIFQTTAAVAVWLCCSNADRYRADRHYLLLNLPRGSLNLPRDFKCTAVYVYNSHSPHERLWTSCQKALG